MPKLPCQDASGDQAGAKVSRHDGTETAKTLTRIPSAMQHVLSRPGHGVPQIRAHETPR
ncbi:MAG: hypothetical protein WBN30_14385 [Polyangiales bacterium]